MIDNEYIPGVCNIGREEIARRKKVGFGGLLLTVITLILFLIFEVTGFLRFLIVIPVFTSAMGFLQARAHFCARFGLTSLFNFGELGKHNKVKDDEFILMDRKKSLKIIFYSLVIGIFCGILAIVA
jgi:hypothetical protein